MKRLILRSILLAVGVAGCNSILDNKPGTLRQTQTPTDTVEQNQPSTGTSDAGSGSSSGDAQSPPPDPTPPPPEGCAQGKRLCTGLCVAPNDPAFGCGATSCKPCAIAHGTAGCGGGACTVATCDKGYADCNGKASDGCEVDLSKSTSCGACNAVCGAAAPNCAPSAGGFQCGTGCAPAAPLLCGTECVEPLTSTNHCGGCGRKCADIPDGTTSCNAGTCAFTCHAGFNACAGRCAAATDATACGPACTPCTAPANATATCASDACGFSCMPNFGDCDGSAATGCEAALLTDPLHCGGCNINCNGGTCTNGVCQAPADPDAGAPPPP